MEEKFDDVLGKDECMACEHECGMEGCQPEVACEMQSAAEYVGDAYKELPDNHAERIAITEADKEIIEKWFAIARSDDMRTYDELTEFLKLLMTKYNHDYGTVIEAMTAGAIAAIHVMNGDKFQGGITGFQAGCIMWEFIKRFNHLEGPMRLIMFEKMLYPQYEYNFERTISKETWEWLQEKAKEKMCKENRAHPDVEAHWQTIIDGKVPFGYTIKEDE
jgi:hypothetical protein